MKVNARKLFSLSFLTLVLTACGGGSTSSNVSSSIAPSANVSVVFPNLFDQNGSKVLPTYISHVITSTKNPLATVTITNTGSATTAQVAIDLPNYGSAATQTITLAAGETKIVNASPIINYTQLFSNTTAVPATVNVTVTSGNTNLFQQSYPIQITGRNTVFWSNNAVDTSPLIATMVTPQDKSLAIQGIIRGAANRFVGVTSMVGYQPANFPAGSYTITPGAYQQESFYVMTGESPSVIVDSVTTTLNNADSGIQTFILDDANFNAWTAGSPSAITCALNNATSAGALIQCTPQATAGYYHIVYYSPPSNTLNRVLTRHRPMMKWEVTYYQAQAIFEELRSRGLVYVNLPGTGFFSAAQNVRYPSESINMQSANCIDGALLFASAFEALGMEPEIALSLPAGHAFVAVRCWTGSTSCVVPVETTMVGGTAPFSAAENAGMTNWNAWLAGGSLRAIDIKAARALGLTPAPM